MFRKLTPQDHHKSVIPFNHLFMTKEQFEEFKEKTHAVDVPIVVSVEIPKKPDEGNTRSAR